MPKPSTAQALALPVIAFSLGALLPFAPAGGQTAVISVLALALFAWPAWQAAREWLGWKRTALAWALLGTIGIVLESHAIATGFPYGLFTYGDVLGPRFLDLAPYALALSWPPIVLMGLAAARSWRDDRRDLFATVAFAAAVMIAVDLLIEPVAIALGMWTWQTPGGWFGMPATNSIGWGLSGALGAIVAHYFADAPHDPERTPQRMVAYGAAYALFWTGANVGLGQWAAALAGLVVAASFAWLARPHHHVAKH